MKATPYCVCLAKTSTGVPVLESGILNSRQSASARWTTWSPSMTWCAPPPMMWPTPATGRWREWWLPMVLCMGQYWSTHATLDTVTPSCPVCPAGELAMQVHNDYIVKMGHWKPKCTCHKPKPIGSFQRRTNGLAIGFHWWYMDLLDKQSAASIT